MAFRNAIPQLEDDVLVNEGSTASIQRNYGYGEKKHVYFAFIDVLGFKQTFDENRENPDSEFAKMYQDTFLYYSKLMNSAMFSVSRELVYAGQTSDSLFFYTDRLDYLVQFLKIYAHFSIDAMSRNVFFRGGIAKGSLFINQPTQYYGNSVIKAYLLESEIAKNPCIAVDSETYLDLRSDLEGEKMVEDTSRGRFCIKPFINVSEDELLSLVCLDRSELHLIDEGVLNVVKSRILKGKERFEFDERNYRKYIYLEEKFEKFKERT